MSLSVVELCVPRSAIVLLMKLVRFNKFRNLRVLFSSIVGVSQADVRTALEWNGAEWVPAPPSALTPPAPAAAAGSRRAAPDAAGKQQPTSTKKGSKPTAPPQPYQVLLPALAGCSC